MNANETPEAAPMAQPRTLVFTTCYNERENIGRLVDEIFAIGCDVDVLVVDDNSPDGTWAVLVEKKSIYPRLAIVQRPRKMGIGTAHKYALLYAMREEYDRLVTMDADFSHSPVDIPRLLAAHRAGGFVTGSRYCEGGRSDYTGYRNLVSRLGNVAARFMLGVQLRELTTYFRVFDVRALRRLPLRRVAANGYSYGVQLIYYLRKCRVDLLEVPIHFVDRTHGTSKIPRMQILWSALDLLYIGLRRLNRYRDLRPDIHVPDRCPVCLDRVLAMKHFGSRDCEEVPDDAVSVAAYRCTAVGAREYPPVYTCLNCGLEQVPESLVPTNLEKVYSEVVDEQYLQNSEARRRTYARSLDLIEGIVGAKRGFMLEVGAYCGLFLQEAMRRGWHCDGVEPSQWAARYARECMRTHVLQGFLSENRLGLRSSYDMVVSWDVLEHVRDPSSFIAECKSFVRPGGLLCLSTLDTNTWFPKVLGRRWPWLMDMHLFYFNRANVRDLLERNGLELVRHMPYTHYARLGYAVAAIGRTLPRWFTPVATAVSRVVPSGWMIPFAFGDIKLFIARRPNAD